ncbi:MAG: ATP-binding protein [Candidatus Eisenbacteria bacterium]|nr:ATP-binding protein [Candidatus Eisenbacteria bacterium]
MAKRRITVELDDETIQCLGVLGDPIEVLANLASSAADGVSRPGHPRRNQTDRSLRIERDKTDVVIARKRKAGEAEADDVVRVARQRADKVVQTAREDADRERRPQSTTDKARPARERTRADGLLKNERSNADTLLRHERAEQSRQLESALSVERDATNEDLIGERAHTDTLIVDQREANEQILKAAMQMQELADEADAARRRSEESERELRAVAEFRELFIGILGHDLRNPLGSIVMSATLLLRRGRIDEQDAETAARIIRSSQRMTRMIAQLLDLTRARLGGGLPIETKPADLREICRNVVEEFGTTIKSEFEGDMTGTWDRDRLEQVFSNLAGNAIEYATPGTVVIIKAHADGAEVVVEIRNKGASIPADLLPFLFEPFRRGEQGEKPVGGNLGLGLYISKQIVLSHGGELDAYSANGTTSFVMRLPRLLADPQS